MMLPLDTAVSVIQRSEDARWQIMLEYEDGTISVSKKIYATEDEAKNAALSWALEHHVPGGKAN